MLAWHNAVPLIAQGAAPMALWVNLIAAMEVCTLCSVNSLVHVQYLNTAQRVRFLVATVMEAVEPLKTWITLILPPSKWQHRMSGATKGSSL